MMLKGEVDSLMKGYFDWLKDNTAVKETNESVIITTPHLDRHNDHLEIVVSRASREKFRLSDDGWILSDLETTGCLLNTPKRKALLRETVNGFGVDIERNEIFVSASKQDFAQKKHGLVQAMLAVNDLFYTSSATTKSFFLEDVENWLKEIDSRFTPKVNFTGKSGYHHKFDFVIPGSRTQPERMLKSINTLTKSSVLTFIAAWEDIKSTRGAEAQAFAVINDNKNAPAVTASEVLEEYGIRPLRWSERHDFADELAA